MSEVKTSLDKNWHAESVEAVFVALNTSTHGLSRTEASQRLEVYGPNRLPEAPKRSKLVRFFSHFNNILIYVLLGSAAITMLLGHFVDTAVILAVVIANAVIGYIQEGKAEKAMEAIRHMLALHASVLREDERGTIEGDALVPGDIVVLEAGDKVPADIRLIQTAGLQIQEAVLTGESVPVEKQTGAVSLQAALGDRMCMAFSGTMVTSGYGKGVVVATGSRTEIGRISGMLSSVETLTTPLVRPMDAFARWLSVFILLIAGILLAFGYFVEHFEFSEMFMAVVGLSVAAIPEGLPAVLTITLAVGVQAMARRHAIVRRLPAIETLGFAHSAALCNDASLHEHNGIWAVEGDPMEGALLTLAGKIGIDVRKERAKWTRTDAIPFDSKHRFMATLNHDHEHHAFVAVKGAPEKILTMCRTQRTSTCGEEPLDAGYWSEKAEQIAAQGQRVLAFAVRPAALDQTALEFSDVESGLTFIALVGMIDPPRPETIDAVAACFQAGIQVKMITGDHRATAAAIGSQIGLKNPNRVLTGPDLGNMDDAKLAAVILDTNIFARTSPEHKLRIHRGGHT